MSVKTFTRLMMIIPLIGMIAFLGATSARAQCGEPPRPRVPPATQLKTP